MKVEGVAAEGLLSNAAFVIVISTFMILLLILGGDAPDDRIHGTFPASLYY